jgi:hypothetical protein
MSLFSKKKNYTTVALFDVGSHSIGGAHLLIPRNEKNISGGIVSSFSRYETAYSDITDIKMYLKKVLDAVKKVAHTIQSSDIHVPEAVYVLLRAPWVSSETKTILYTKATPFSCTNKLIEELVEKEIEEIASSDNGSYIIEKQISSLMLNGYVVENPYNKKTKELTITFTVTRGSKIIIDYIKSGIESSYSKATIYFNSIASAVHNVSEKYIYPFDDLFLVIAGEQLTEVGLIKNRVFYQYESFFPGIGLLYTSIAEEKQISIGEAYSVLEAFRLSKLSEKEQDDIRKIVLEYKEKWQKAFRDTISKKEYGLCLPDKCCIVSREKFSNVLADAIKSDPYLLHNCGNVGVTPFFLNESILGSHVSFPEGVSFDVMTSIHALFVMSLVRYTS